MFYLNRRVAVFSVIFFVIFFFPYFAMAGENDLDMYWEVGLTLFHQKNYSQAKKQFEEILAIDPECGKAHFYMAEILYKFGDLDGGP